MSCLNQELIKSKLKGQQQIFTLLGLDLLNPNKKIRKISQKGRTKKANKLFLHHIVKNVRYLSTFLILAFFSIATAHASPSKNTKPPTKSKFYDFAEQLIDGQIRKPTALFVNSRERARFKRLLKLKKSFLPQLFKTSKQRVFK